MKKLKEVSMEELIQDLKNASIGGVDEFKEVENDEVLEVDYEIEDNDIQVDEAVNADFKKLDDSLRKQKELKRQKLEFEILNKNNSILQEYLAILNSITEIESEIKVNNTALYESMVKADTKKLESNICKITLKKPYPKTEFNLKLFKEDYKENSKMYKRYVSEKMVKGNIVVTIKED